MKKTFLTFLLALYSSTAFAASVLECTIPDHSPSVRIDLGSELMVGDPVFVGPYVMKLLVFSGSSDTYSDATLVIRNNPMVNPKTFHHASTWQALELKKNDKDPYGFTGLISIQDGPSFFCKVD